MHLGSHLSIAGGVDRALWRAKDYGFEALGMFVRNQRQWDAPPLEDQSVRDFRDARKPSGVQIIIAHSSYLVNLASDDRDLHRRSVEAVVEDLQRCVRLGIEHLVLHPGTDPDRDDGIARIAEGLNKAMGSVKQKSPITRILLETTAGQGNSIGCRFEDIGEIFGQLDQPRRFGICMDTAHMFAAGYDFRTPETCDETIRALDDCVGLHRLRAIHANDSLKPLGSRVDRHAHIGNGCIGREGFAELLARPELQDLPWIMETPKGTRESDGRDWDRINGSLLRTIARKAGANGSGS